MMGIMRFTMKIIYKKSDVKNSIPVALIIDETWQSDIAKRYGG